MEAREMLTTAEREAKRLRNQAAIKRELELNDIAITWLMYQVSTWGERLPIVSQADDYNSAQGSNFNPQGWGK